MTDKNASVSPAANLTQHAVYGPPNPKKPPRPTKHAWFDPWLIPKGIALNPLIREVADFVDCREKRKRRRRPDDQKRHDRMVVGVVCNLARAVVSPPQPSGWLATNTRNGERGKDRYDNTAFGTTFRELLTLLELAFLYRQLPVAISGEVASIAPTSRFEAMVIAAGISADDFASDQEQELIRLTQVTRSYSPLMGPHSDKQRIDYADNAYTNGYRAELRVLNAYLADADITFITDDLEPRVDAHVRTLRRYFTTFAGEEPRFDQGGRLFGAFWQSLKRDRRLGIMINGEPVAELDYQSMFQRLAYAELGKVPPDGDLYLIPPIEAHRDGIKLAMNCFLFDQTERRTWPKDMSMYGDDTDDDPSHAPKLPRGLTVKKAKQMILAKHPDLEAAWGHGLGYRLMWQESRILMAVLTDLMTKDIPALGLHDGLLVPVSARDVALKTMRHWSRQLMGIELPCSVK
jgi:hypothetical protein